MKARNITPIVEYSLMAVWVVGISTLTTALLPEVVAFIVGVSLGVGGVRVMMWFFRGQRLWIRNGQILPIGFMWKPRGYSMSSNLKGKLDDDGSEVVCASCENEFEATYDHFRSDSNHYCPDCSRVGEIVMKNYREWFDSTEDVRQTAD